MCLCVFLKKKKSIPSYTLITISLLFFINTLLKVESAVADSISSLSTGSLTPSTLSPATSKFTETFFSTNTCNLHVIKSNDIFFWGWGIDLLDVFKHSTGFIILFWNLCFFGFFDTMFSLLVLHPPLGLHLSLPCRRGPPHLLFKS